MDLLEKIFPFTSISNLSIDMVSKQGSSFKSQKILVKETNTFRSYQKFSCTKFVLIRLPLGASSYFSFLKSSANGRKIRWKPGGVA